MSVFKPLQLKRPFTSTAAAPASSVLRPFRPPASLSIPASEAVSRDLQPGLERTARFAYSLAHIPIDPPEKNDTGLPDRLKAGIESLSGISLNDVRVHYNSPKPARMHAWAYTQGTEIHIGPHQEKHLSHEAWHVVQQKQGRVQPTLKARDVAINDDKVLENEASVMGEHAVRHNEREIASMQESLSSILVAQPRVAGPFSVAKHLSSAHRAQNVIQGMFWELTPEGKYIWHWGPVISRWWTPTGEQHKESGNQRAYGVYTRNSAKQSLPPASPMDTSPLNTAPSNSTLLRRDLPQEGEQTERKESNTNNNISPSPSPRQSQYLSSSFESINDNYSSTPSPSPRFVNINNNNNNNTSSSSSSSYEQPWKQYEKKKREGKSNTEFY